MEKLLSYFRRISFVCIIMMLIITNQIPDLQGYFAATVACYLGILLFSYIYYFFLNKKYPNMKAPFISRLWRQDVCNPIINLGTRGADRLGSRLGGLWNTRRSQHRSKGEKLKSFFVRLIIYTIIAIIVYAVFKALILP